MSALLRTRALHGVMAAVPLLIGLAFLIWQAQQLPPRAAMFPMVLLWLMVVALAAHAASMLRVRIAGKPVKSSTAYEFGMAGALGAVALGAAVYLIPHTGFYATTAVLHLVLYLLCARAALPAGLLREMSRGVVFSAVMTLTNWIIFDFLLALAVPAGRFF